MLHSTTLAIDSSLLTLIWLVQLGVYPSFRYLERDHFKTWHNRYTRRMGFIAGPLMIAQLGISLVNLYQTASYDTAAYALLVSLTWITTFLISVPLHRKLETRGKDTTTINLLIRTNWIRTLLWSVIAIANLTNTTFLATAGDNQLN